MRIKLRKSSRITAQLYAFMPLTSQEIAMSKFGSRTFILMNYEVIIPIIYRGSNFNFMDSNTVLEQ